MNAKTLHTEAAKLSEQIDALARLAADHDGMLGGWHHDPSRLSGLAVTIRGVVIPIPMEAARPMVYGAIDDLKKQRAQLMRQLRETED